MRSVAIGAVLLLTSATLAGPAPTTKALRKPAPVGVPGEILKLFVGGIVADKAGDLDKAAHRYDDANRKSPQANTYYNLADVERRMEKIPQAIKSYKKYLELAPSAPDRKDVEKLIEQLANSDFVAVIDGEEVGALIFVDGKYVGTSPQVIRLPPGKHAADRISPTGHRHQSFEARPATTDHVTLSDWSPRKKTEPGNVLLSGSAFVTMQGSWQDQGITFEFPARMTLAPGHYETFLFDQKRACTPITFDVPKVSPNAAVDEITFVYVDAKERAPGDYKCIPITVRQQQVKVAL